MGMEEPLDQSTPLVHMYRSDCRVLVISNSASVLVLFDVVFGLI